MHCIFGSTTLGVKTFAWTENIMLEVEALDSGCKPLFFPSSRKSTCCSFCYHYCSLSLGYLLSFLLYFWDPVNFWIPSLLSFTRKNSYSFIGTITFLSCSFVGQPTLAGTLPEFGFAPWTLRFTPSCTFITSSWLFMLNLPGSSPSGSRLFKYCKWWVVSLLLSWLATSCIGNDPPSAC